MIIHSSFILVGALFAATSVALGAFGAHALQSRVTKERLETFQTGVQYQFYHSIGIILTGIIAPFLKGNVYIIWASWLMICGILLFSGSLYLLVLTDKRWFGIITPFGGLAFIAGWLMLALSFVV